MDENKDNKDSGLSRRDFLKLAGLGLCSLAFRNLPSLGQERTESSLTGREIESKVFADKIPVLEYHYPGYSDAGVALPEDFYNTQIKYLVDGGYRTVSDKEFNLFLNSGNNLTAKTVALRIDQGAAHFDEFEKMIGVLKANRLSAMVFVSTGEQISDSQWQKMADWQKNGIISLGSHSVTHTDFRQISDDSARFEAINSKQTIEKRLTESGVKAEVISFAFPGDSVPDNIDFLKTAGYKFCLGGNLFGVKNNSANPGLYLIPSLYPYVSRKLLEITKANTSNNPLAYSLSGGYTFDEMIRMNTTPVTVRRIEEILKLKPEEVYPEISFGRVKELPISDAQKKSLVRPVGIIIHTDDQPGDGFEKWITDRTYNGLDSRELDVHFSVGVDGITQFLKMYKDFCMFTRGARGFGNYISIEMCGRDYDLFFDNKTPPAKKIAIEMITKQTVELVKELARNYGFSTNNVLGHYQASASGKSDPGKDYMEKLFLPLLNSSSLQGDRRISSPR